MWKSLTGLLGALLVSACTSNPNSLRSFSEIDGPWVAVVSSPNCGIAQTFAVDIAGRAFGVRIPQTDIFLSGVVRDGVVRTEFTQQAILQGNGQPPTEISQIEINFERSDLARGTWRSSRCSGTVTLMKGAS